MTAPLCPGCLARQTQRPLTKRQAEVLLYLEDYSEQHRYMPTVEEIARYFGFRSLATVHEHLENLVAKGKIVRRFNEARSIQIVAGA
jgi:repressor LexA